MTAMFQAKIVKYERDQNGNLVKVEKNFDDPTAYQRHLHEIDQEELSKKLPDHDQHSHNTSYHPSLSVLGHPMSFSDRHTFHKYMEDLVGEKVMKQLWWDDNYHEEDDNKYDNTYQDTLVNLDKYEYAKQELEDRKQREAQALENAKETLKKLEDYETLFKKEKQYDMVESIQEDIKRMKKKITKLESDKTDKKTDKKTNNKNNETKKRT